MRYTKLEKKLIKNITSYEIKNYDASFQEMFQEVFKKNFDNSGVKVREEEIILYLKNESNDKLRSYKYKLIALIILLKNLEDRKLMYFIKKNDKKEYLYNPLYKKTPSIFKVDVGKENLDTFVGYLHSDFYISENLKDEIKFKIFTKENISLIIAILAFLISLGGGVIDYYDLGRPKSIVIREPSSSENIHGPDSWFQVLRKSIKNLI